MVDVGGAGAAGRGDAIVDDAGLDGGTEATGRLDLLEDVPRPLGQLLGESLDVPRAAGRVDHPGHVRLQREHRLGVAGEAVAELARPIAGRRSRAGSTVTASAPPTAAAKQATVARTMLTARVVAGRHRP